MFPISSSDRIIAALSLFVIFVSISPAFRVQAQSVPDSSEKEKTQKKRGLAPLRQEEAPEGSRVTVTYNGPLSDYSAYRQGDRFVVVIPKADAPRVRGKLRGRGFDDVQVSKRGDDAVLSFRIQPGARARVDQQFNRLDVVFSAPEQQRTNAASNTKQPASAPAQGPASKASQATQTPLTNHNTTTAQPNDGKPSRDSSVEASATGAQPTPHVNPAATSSSLRIMAARYWLPLLIAALLLTSAWVVIASRRRAAPDGTRTEVEPAVEQQDEKEADVRPSPEFEEEARELEVVETSRALDEAFGRIGAAFDDPVQQVRDAAARSLFNVSADRVASFKRIMRESSPERRRRIGEAIASSGMASEAISDLTSQSGERAYDALLVLSLMARAGEVRSLIEAIEEHPSTEVRLAVVKLLALSGQPHVLQTFRYLSTRDSIPIAVRSSIMEAIYQLNNPLIKEMMNAE